MNALSNATAIALLAAAATVANAQTHEQIPPPTRSDPNGASSVYQSRATTASIIGTSNANSKDATAPGPRQREAIENALTPTAFASIVAQAGMTEVALGGLALRKSSNDRVKLFALKLVQDHAQVNDELQSLVKRRGLVLPTSLEAKYHSVVMSLDAKSGGAFDKAYIKHIAHDHSAAIALFEAASNSSDADIAAFARKTLPTLREHESLADALQASNEIQTASAR